MPSGDKPVSRVACGLKGRPETTSASQSNTSRYATELTGTRASRALWSSMLPATYRTSSGPPGHRRRRVRRAWGAETRLSTGLDMRSTPRSWTPPAETKP